MLIHIFYDITSVMPMIKSTNRLFDHIFKIEDKLNDDMFIGALNLNAGVIAGELHVFVTCIIL